MNKLTSVIISIFSAVTVIFGAEQMKLQILDATVKNKKVPNAEVIFQKNGETSVKATTNSEGYVNIPMPFGKDDSTVTIIVKKSGYSTMVAKGPSNGLTYALSPVMKQLDGLRVVLSWDQEPRDLDSHISYPGNHIFFQQKKGTKAHLDVDDTDSYGPETITIVKKFYEQGYVYAVHNYSDEGSNSSSRLSNISGAKVFVYIGETLIKTYYVPKGKQGNLWVVFSIDGHGEFHDINQFFNTSHKGVNRFLSTFREKNEIPAELAASQSAQKESKRINKKGEQAYHANNLEKSVEHYQKAIELDPNNGQAYSNLGLSFQKLNRIAEALWANRKAIALAHGRKKHIIQASSYYNIAKIYEKKGQWEDALQNYKLASERRQHNAYTKGINRMKAKLRQ